MYRGDDEQHDGHQDDRSPGESGDYAESSDGREGQADGGEVRSDEEEQPEVETVVEGVEDHSEPEAVPEPSAEIVVIKEEIRVPLISTLDTNTVITIGDYDEEDFTEYIDEVEEEVAEEVTNNNPEATEEIIVIDYLRSQKTRMEYELKVLQKQIV